jgi:cholesterol oxidase
MTSSDTADSLADLRRTRSLSIGLVDLAVQLRKAPETIFDVVIVGSGYGASVAAQKLAGLTTIENGRMRAITVCVLERGAEYLPGMFPSALSEMPAHVRTSVQGSGRVMGNREGLFDVRMGADVSALVANGLGGGSLINAGVLLEPDFSSFESGLPRHLTDALKDHFLSQAKKLLLGTPPQSRTTTITDSPHFGNDDYPLKFHRMQDLARGGKTAPPLYAKAAEITVAMHARQCSPHSVNLNPCNGCGDCMTGCNVGAKASLDTNLLAQAHQAGAQLVTGASVLSLFRVDRQARRQEELRDPAGAGDLWVIDVVHTSPALQLRESKAMKVRARRVILAAGTLGTPEILLRSRSDRLSLSNKLGERFSCNGDNIAAVHGLPKKAHSTDDEFRALEERKVGPTITSMIAVPRKGDRLGFWIQEFSVPAPLKSLFAEIVTTGHMLAGLQSADRKPHGNENPGELDPCAVDPDAIENTLLVGLIGHDSADGSLRLPLPGLVDGRAQHQEGTLQIVWPQARYGEQLHAAHKTLKALCEKSFNGADVIANPMWRLLPDGLEGLVSQPLGPVLTVHPLGGCVIGRDVTSGVVNEYGQVFNARGALDTDVFDGLVVLDGSIIAGSLGANPSLTIAALALRAVGHLKKNVWKFADPDSANELGDLPPRPIAADPMPVETQTPQATKVAIVERLWGHILLQNGASQPGSFLIELTLIYEPVKLHALMARWGEREVKVDPDLSHLRLYPSGDWNNQTRRFSSDVQRFWEDHERQPHLVCELPLSGTLRFLHREESSGLTRTVRGFCAYLGNRGWRDLWQELCLDWKAWRKPAQPTTAWKPMPAKRGIFASIKAGWSVVANGVKLASRAGEVRRFDYALTVGVGAPGAGSAASPELAALLAGLVITGEKRLTYSRRGNPWGQLTTLTLTHLALLAPASNRVLRLDAQYMVQKNLPLLQVVAQQDKVSMALDMTHFALFMARLMLTIHLWSFRKPDASPPRVAQRLPGVLEGLPPPEITELTVALNRKTQAPVIVRLTRYRRPLKPKQRPQPPLAMIHGYSVSGTTFAHHSLKPGAARYFCDQGRDVWVIDLRTSAGLPTALQPWAMEEVALVDIPAALLHIKNTTGQRVDVIGHCIGAAMLGMALLTDARNIRNATVQLGFDTWITPAQLGTLTAFNGDGDGGEGKPHPTVRSVVLSQKGPLLRYTEENIFRAYLMRSLRRWLVPGGYQFEAKANPGVADQLLDRLLASQHYDDADYDIENPSAAWKTTPWTSTRHRVDALFGRVFAARHLSEETLAAIDDFFGPVNIDTVSQTIHFVRFSCITNQRGRGEFVTLANLRKRWSGIPTLSIHGAGNGLVDVSTQSLLKANFEAAGIALRQKIYPELEHQDVWIGQGAEAVFLDIETFLKTPEHMGPPVPVKAPCWRFELPWIGPRLVRGGNEVTLYALSSPKFGAAQLVLVPVRLDAVSGRFERYGSVLQSNLGDSRAWITADLTRNWPAPNNPAQQGWLAFMAYGCDQTTLTEADSITANAQSRGGWLGANVAALVKAIELWLASSRLELCSCLVTLADVARQRHVSPLGFDFALASCRYPAGLLDSKPAQAALQTLAGWPPWSPPDLDFVIFCGDQIYADATAGVMDPSRRDERYDLPYEAALRAEPMRRLLRAVPAYTLPDDHEIVDNWEPPHPSRREAARQGKVQRRQALAAFWNYQRLSVWNDQRGSVLHGRTSFSFDHGCASFFMLDTRSQRKYRKPGETAGAGMFLTQEFDRLEDWLCKSPSLVKFIVTPSAVLPRRLGALNQNIDHVARGDAWEGYPGNFEAVLGLIARKKIRNVVFLSGDEHLGCVVHADISIECEGKTECARIVSIHASGLYAPFPFANSQASEFVQGRDAFFLGAVHCIATPKFARPGSVFANLRVACNALGPSLSVEFWVNGERIDFPIVLTNREPCQPVVQPAGAEIPIAAAL